LKNLLLITPPFTQLNTPYPATAYLKGFLNSKNISSYQMDLGIEVILALFTKGGLKQVFNFAADQDQIESANARRIFALRKAYENRIESVIEFLQGKNQTFARQICAGDYLPQASRFAQVDDMEWAFGNMGIQDQAKHLATLFIEDISDFIVECVDEHFGFSRYAERLGMSANSFEEIHDTLKNELSLIEEITLSILEQNLSIIEPKLVCFSVPFPGNLFSAFRCAQYIKKHHPEMKIAMGGGFSNTELRSVSDVRVFDYFDFISLDDGELPIELIAGYVLNTSDINPSVLKRTFCKENGQVVYNNFSLQRDYQQHELPCPDYSDLNLDQYISVIEIANPMHSLWTDGRWNKLTMAHGCYWGKCTFCDISLDYIKNYEPVAANLLVDRVEQLIAQTGETGFHFVDEAAPPALMRDFAIEVIRRQLTITWWTNIRFEKSFTRDLCQLLKHSGCIAVSGGLEVASNRLLKLIDKGVTVEQVARVTDNFTEAGVMVHAYLMYGFPTQTIQETVDSLEMVRQLFESGVLQSGFWHQFALTAHSPVGLQPADYGIMPDQKAITFANNDIQFEDATGIDHNQFSHGLKKSLFNYMHGIGFDFPLQDWFDFEIPETTVDPNLIMKSINTIDGKSIKPSSRILWMAAMPVLIHESKKKSNIRIVQLEFHDMAETFELKLEKKVAIFLLETLAKLTIGNREVLTFGQIEQAYNQRFEKTFEEFWYSASIDRLRQHGLLVL
jgi:hypothetical protein